MIFLKSVSLLGKLLLHVTIIVIIIIIIIIIIILSYYIYFLLSDSSFCGLIDVNWWTEEVGLISNSVHFQ